MDWGFTEVLDFGKGCDRVSHDLSAGKLLNFDLYSVAVTQHKLVLEKRGSGGSYNK